MYNKLGTNRYLTKIAAVTLLAGFAFSALAQTPPAPGVSPRIDAVRKAGVLRVGVVNNPPWLVQNTTGTFTFDQMSFEDLSMHATGTFVGNLFKGSWVMKQTSPNDTSDSGSGTFTFTLQ